MLAWVALVPLLLVLRLTSQACYAFAAAGVWGMAAAYGVTSWLPTTLADYYGQPFLLGLGLFLCAAAAMGALEYALFAIAWRRALLQWPALTVPLAAAGFAAAELGRARVLTGNPWGLLGYSQMGLTKEGGDLAASLALRVVQVADFGGVFAVSFVIIAVNAALAEVLLAGLQRSRAASLLGEDQHTSRPGLGLGFAASLVLLSLLYGEAQLRAAPEPDGRARVVGIVQANLDRGARWDPSLYGANLASYLELSATLAAPDPAASATSSGLDLGQAAPLLDLMVWPENAMTFFVADEADYRAAIARSLAPLAQALLAGAPRVEGHLSPRYFNAAVLMGKDGDVLDYYDKEHLLPFAEYFPFGAIEVLQRNFGRVRSFTAGVKNEPLSTPAGNAAVVICNEAMFSRVSRARYREDVDFLVNLSNDSWVRDPSFALHQFHLVSMRSIELGLPLVRASTSGPSAVVDAFGRVLARSEVGVAQTLRASLPRRRPATVYARFGDWFALLCLFGTLACCWKRG